MLFSLRLPVGQKTVPYDDLPLLIAEAKYGPCEELDEAALMLFGAGWLRDESELESAVKRGEVELVDSSFYPLRPPFSRGRLEKASITLEALARYLERINGVLEMCNPEAIAPAPLGAASDGPAPLATAPAWSLIPSLSRAPGYRWPLYQFLKAAHAAGEPCPKARDVLEGWKLNTPPELEVMTDGVKYNDGLGNSKEAGLKAIQQAIKNLLN